MRRSKSGRHNRQQPPVCVSRAPFLPRWAMVLALVLLWSWGQVDAAHGQTFGTVRLGGGSIAIVGADVGTTTANFAQVVVASGASLISVSNGLGDGTTLNMGPITRHVGGTLNLLLPDPPGAITTTNGNIDGIVGGYLTISGTDWATGTGGSSPFALQPVSSYADDVWAPGNHTTVVTSNSPAAGSTTASLRFNSAGGLSLTLTDDAGQANVITSGGILVTPNVGAHDLSIAASPAGAHLTSGNAQDLIVIHNNPLGLLTVGPTISDNGATPVGLTKSGSGTLLLAPATANSYSGATTINGGVLSVSDIGNGGTPSAIGQSTSAAGNLVLNGGGLRYTGDATTTDRLLSLGLCSTLGARGGTIESSGAGPITFANTGAIEFNSLALLTLTLGGSNTDNNSFAPLLGDQTSIFGNVPSALRKSGGGTWILTNANTYSGDTTIDAGTLLVQNIAGSATGTGDVLVQAGATLGGTGTITGPVTFDGGILAPGNSAGTLALGPTVFDAASILEFQLDMPGIVGNQINDLAAVAGNLTLDGTLDVTGLANFGSGFYRLFNYSGALTDNGLTVGLLPSGYAAVVDTSIAHQVNLNVALVPEPATIVLAGAGAIGFVLCARRRRRR